MLHEVNATTGKRSERDVIYSSTLDVLLLGAGQECPTSTTVECLIAKDAEERCTSTMKNIHTFGSSLTLRTSEVQAYLTFWFSGLQRSRWHVALIFNYKAPMTTPFLNVKVIRVICRDIIALTSILLVTS